MSLSLDTEHWHLAIDARWRRKKYEHAECPRCHGRGKTGGMWADPDPAVECDSCHGSGAVDAPPPEPKPEIPEALVTHMRAAYQEFCRNHFTKES